MLGLGSGCWVVGSEWWVVGSGCWVAVSGAGSWVLGAGYSLDIDGLCVSAWVGCADHQTRVLYLFICAVLVGIPCWDGSPSENSLDLKLILIS